MARKVTIRRPAWGRGVTMGIFIGLLLAPFAGCGVCCVMVMAAPGAWPLGLIAVVLSPVVGGVLGARSAVEGACPYCGQPIFGLSGSGGITCRACKKRVVIDKAHGLFYTTEAD